MPGHDPLAYVRHLTESDKLNLNSARSRVFKLLLDGQWHRATELTGKGLGGSEGTKRARELREYGMVLQELPPTKEGDDPPKKAMQNYTGVWLYRLDPESVTHDMIHHGLTGNWKNIPRGAPEKPTTGEEALAYLGRWANKTQSGLGVDRNTVRLALGHVQVLEEIVEAYKQKGQLTLPLKPES